MAKPPTWGMCKRSRSPQNGEVAGDAALRDVGAVEETAAPSRQRPEEILAQTLSGPGRQETADGWSAKGRRVFLLCMAVAGVVLVVAGLLVTKELAPRPGNPAPLETGPGNGVADQLLRSSSGEEPPPAPSSASAPLPLPLAPAPTSGPTRSNVLAPSPVATDAPGQATGGTTGPTTPTTTAPPSPTTTLPCSGVIGQTLQQSQLLPCRLGSGSLRSKATTP